MNYKHEQIKYLEALGINVSIHEAKMVASHWHNSLEILLITKGEVSLSLRGNVYELKEDDVIVINSKEIHAIKSQTENVIVAVQLNLNYFKTYFPSIEDYVFDCFSQEVGYNELAFLNLRQLLTQIVQLHFKKSRGHQIKLNGYACELMYMLLQQFATDSVVVGVHKSYKHLERLDRVIKYIKKHYTEDITLTDVAATEELSPQYFSKFFEKHMGVNFLTYLNSIRLEHAVKDLTYTDYHITDIAMNYGFSNVTSFTNYFKNAYGQTPSQYRKLNQTNEESIEFLKAQGIQYLQHNTNDLLESVTKYATPLTMPIKEIKPELLKQVTLQKSIRVNDTTKPLLHTWKNLMTIGKAKEGLFAPVQEQIKTLQATNQFSHIRFHGIFDDTMMVYGEDAQGEPTYNFMYVFSLFDFLQSIKLKPFIELGFMPKQLAKRTDKTVFYVESIISEPKDMSRWCELLNAFLRACINRYGIDEVRTWYFEVWNEPDFKDIFSFDSPEMYSVFFKVTYETFKKMDSALLVGGPAMVSTTLTLSNWFEHFISDCKVNQCIPDFITFHSYPIIVKALDKEVTKSSTISVIDSDETYLEKIITLLKKQLKQFGLSHLPIYLTEWNATPIHREFTNDTLYKASYIVKNILDNLDSLNGLGYWAGTDWLEESRLPQNVFHGGLGLVTYNDLKKPGFYAYECLQQLGDELIERGEHYIVTKRGQSYQVLLHNYCHFSEAYCQGECAITQNLSRYESFDDQQLNFELKLCDITPGTYLIEKRHVSREHGSVYDQWLRMGHPQDLSQSDVTYLNGIASPKRNKQVQIIHDEYMCQGSLKPHDVMLVTLTWQY